jgi:hypothetical protein
MATRKWLSASVAAVLIGLSAPTPIRADASASANDLDRMTYVTFSRAVALPGVELRTGTYIFELADPLGAWNLVRVSSRDRRHVYLTAFTRIVDRPSGMNPDQPISFGEAGRDQAPPINAWFPTGESTGRQFIY